MRNYKEMYENYKFLSTSQVEPGFIFLCWVLNHFTSSPYSLFSVYSLLNILFVYFGIKNFTPYVFYNKEEALKGGNKEKESKLYNPLIFIQAGENAGFAAGNNIGIKYALAKDDFEYVWLLNNDTVIEKNSLSSLVCYASKNDLGISGSVLIYYDNPKQVQAYGGSVNKFFGTSKDILNKKEIEKNLII